MRVGGNMGNVEGVFSLGKLSSSALTVSLLLAVTSNTSRDTRIVSCEGSAADLDFPVNAAHVVVLLGLDEVFSTRQVQDRETIRLQACHSEELERPSQGVECELRGARETSVPPIRDPEYRGAERKGRPPGNPGSEEGVQGTDEEIYFLYPAVVSQSPFESPPGSYTQHTTTDGQDYPSPPAEGNILGSFALHHDEHVEYERSHPPYESRDSSQDGEGGEDASLVRLEELKPYSSLPVTSEAFAALSLPASPIRSVLIARRLGAVPSADTADRSETLSGGSPSGSPAEEANSSDSPKEAMGLFGHGGAGSLRQRQQMAQAMSMMGMRMPPPGSMTPQQQQQMIMLMYGMQEQQQRLMGQQAQLSPNMMLTMPPYQQSPEMMQQMLALQQQQADYGRGGSGRGGGGRRNHHNHSNSYGNQGMYGFNSNMGNPYTYYPNNSPMMGGIVGNNPMYYYYPNSNTQNIMLPPMPGGGGGGPAPMRPQQAPTTGNVPGMYYSSNMPSQPYSMPNMGTMASQPNAAGMPAGLPPSSTGLGGSGGMMIGFSNQQGMEDRGGPGGGRREGGGGAGGGYDTSPYDPNLAEEQRRMDEGARWAEQLRRQQENWARNNS